MVLSTLFKTCSDPVVHALQFLDVINMKDPSQKSHFYRVTLTDILPAIPKVRSCLCKSLAVPNINISIPAAIPSIPFFLLCLPLF